MPTIDYLLHSNSTFQRDYARAIASDGIITYSISTDFFAWVEPETSKRWASAEVATNSLPHDIEQTNWIDRIFAFVDSITGVVFEKVEVGRGEIHISKVDAGSSYDLGYGDGESFGNGYIQWNDVHNRKQYGGVQDIRSLQTAIASALGVSRPYGDYSNPAFSWDNTLMSGNTGALDSWGASFFYTQDDQDALRSILGTEQAKRSVNPIYHTQKQKEDLLIGVNGQVDIFKLNAKGMILKEDAGTEYDEFGAAIINNYNIPYIANFNGEEGDRILINRRLFNPTTPVDGNQPNRNRPPKKIRIRFKQTFNPDEDRRSWESKYNVLYNDAGKLLLNTNGVERNLGPQTIAPTNDQLVAFVDPVGPENTSFSRGWIGIF